MFIEKWDDLGNNMFCLHIKYWVSVIYLHIVYLQFTKSLFFIFKIGLAFGIYYPW